MLRERGAQVMTDGVTEAMRSSVFEHPFFQPDFREMYARGRLQKAQEEYDLLLYRFQRAHELLAKEVVERKDFYVAGSYLDQISSIINQMAYWKREISKWEKEVEAK
jgi:hypothetical protein